MADGRLPHLLDTPSAGPAAIRGGAIRVAGYGAGIVITTLSAALLFRHLGVEDGGRYVTVVALVSIVAGLTDAGLTGVATRELVDRDPSEHDPLLRNLIGMRLFLGVAGLAGAVAFAALAGYGSAMVFGTALAGFGAIIQTFQNTLAVQLMVDLRLGWVTVLEFVRQVATVVGIAVLVVLIGAGPRLVLRRADPCVAGRGRGDRIGWSAARCRCGRSFALGEWRVLAARRAPVRRDRARSRSCYFRVALIMLSLVSDADQTGYFGASFRVTEVLISVPQLAVAGAFPIFVRAARDDRDRLAYGVGRMFHSMAVAGVGMASRSCLGATFIIAVVAGADFAPAARRDAHPGRDAVRSLPRRDVQLCAAEPARSPRDAADHRRRARPQRDRAPACWAPPTVPRARRSRRWSPTCSACSRAAGRWRGSDCRSGTGCACSRAWRWPPSRRSPSGSSRSPMWPRPSIALLVYGLPLVLVRGVPEELCDRGAPAARIGCMSRPLRVGLNLVYLVEGAGGAGTYARELIPALLAVEPETRITAFVGRTAPPDSREAAWASQIDWVTLPVVYDSSSPWTPLLNGTAQWAALPWIAARRRLDVVHGLANVVPLVSPRVARVVSLLDLIWLHFPSTMSRRATLAMKATALPSARVADRVIAISHAAKRDMVETVGLDPDKIDVTPLGVRDADLAEPTAEADLRAELGLGRARIVLCVAQKREHKNLANLIRAVAGLEDDVALALVGSPTPHEAELRALAQELGVEGRIHFPGWLSSEQLEGLYRSAALFVLPSLEEGFGLPLLEAMRRGTPVACSNVSSLPEVVGPAAALFDPLDVDDMRAVIARVLADPALAARLVEAGYERCRGFTWEAAARATLESYRRAIAARRG